jgi:glycosyltransferase involved in cell wall biosynthesis
MCVVAATPLTVHFFLKPHLVELSQYFEVTLVCNPKNDAYLPPLDLPVRQLAVGIARKISPLSDLLTLFELCRLFRREHFDVVVSVVPKAGMLGMVAAALARVKLRVHIFQGEVWASRRGFMRALLKTMDRVIVKMATDILAVSASERRFLEEQGVARSGQVRVLGSGSISGVDMARFQPDSEARGNFRKDHGIPDEAVVCLFLGRLTADKGIFDLLSAFALSGEECANLWLVFAGPDEEGMGNKLRSALEGDVAERFIIEGFTHLPERYVAAADFLCLPSYREGFGMVIIEAAACGIPSIGSRIYGIVDAIKEDETGLLVNPGDVLQLSKALNSLVKDIRLRADLASAARIRVESEFEQKKVVGRYVSFFRQLCDEERITAR